MQSGRTSSRRFVRPTGSSAGGAEPRLDWACRGQRLSPECNDSGSYPRPNAPMRFRRKAWRIWSMWRAQAGFKEIIEMKTINESRQEPPREGASDQMSYDQALHAKRTELRPVTRLQEIQGSGASYPKGTLFAGDLKMDLDRSILWKGHREIQLSPKEWDLLSYLFKNQGTLVTHVKLLRAVWG